MAQALTLPNDFKGRLLEAYSFVQVCSQAVVSPHCDECIHDVLKAAADSLFRLYEELDDLNS
jgi:hypothetical protein